MTIKLFALAFFLLACNRSLVAGYGEERNEFIAAAVLYFIGAGLVIVAK